MTRYAASLFRAVSDGPHFSIKSFAHPVIGPILIGGVHLMSKLYAQETDQYYGVRLLIESVSRAEVEAKHERAILIGDFNVAPFETAAIAADGLHATMDRSIAKRCQRTVQGKQFKFLYNPMWNLLGDENNGVPGTYFYQAGPFGICLTKL